MATTLVYRTSAIALVANKIVMLCNLCPENKTELNLMKPKPSNHTSKLTNQ